MQYHSQSHIGIHGSLSRELPPRQVRESTRQAEVVIVDVGDRPSPSLLLSDALFDGDEENDRRTASLPTRAPLSLKPRKTRRLPSALQPRSRCEPFEKPPFIVIRESSRSNAIDFSLATIFDDSSTSSPIEQWAFYHQEEPQLFVPVQIGVTAPTESVLRPRPLRSLPLL